MASYAEFFETVTGNPPFPYQERLGTEPWPDVLDIPTGLGKTAGVVVAWLWKKLDGDDGTPRRLVYCLPMRALVDQTASAVEEWLQRAAPHFEAKGAGLPIVQTLMGGQLDRDWRRRPEGAAILIGTQDMLLSRALMRGYGMSRYEWAVDYAFLHNDAMWAFDEVQLMGPAVSTSAQIEAFRREWDTAKPSRSLWMSATLRPQWLETVDFRPFADTFNTLGVSAADRDRATDRLDAKKALQRCSVTLEKLGASAVSDYVTQLASEVIEHHRPASQTLVIVNRVDRAQALFKALQKESPDASLLLLHARFRSKEREGIEAALRDDEQSAGGRIVVATQAVEAGVDMTSATMFSELAPWSSMVQRFGRCNRYGEVEAGAKVIWIDLQLEGKDAAPYEKEDLDASRRILEVGLSDVGPGSLPPFLDERPLTQVLRRKDFLELFNTDPDLSGFDVDVAPYIRDPGSPQVQVFWRVFDDAPDPKQPKPLRRELCNVSMGQIAEYRKKRGKHGERRAWLWDPLMKRWQRKGPTDSVVPGSVLLLKATDGGYSSTRGFDPAAKEVVDDLRPDEGEALEVYDADGRSNARDFIELEDHLEHVIHEAEALCGSLSMNATDARPVVTSAAWHDVGKAHPAFQTVMLDAAIEGEDRAERLWAKSPGRGSARYRIEGDEVQKRPYFRHELASMLAWLERAPGDSDVDLIAYLIVAHHGKVRMGLRALPTEHAPADGRLIARGVWDGDELPPLRVAGTDIPATVMKLDLMQMGRGTMGASWIERTHHLLESRGPFVLAWLESLLRVADWRASAKEDAGDANE